MTIAFDITILELLASKICHDVISPIGAVNNGVELITEMGAEAVPDATELIGFSAQQASAKLQAFRLAYGAGGADAIIKVSDVHKTIQQIVGAEKKITQSWNANADLGPIAAQKGFCKILTCVLLLAMESLPKGGKLIVAADGNSAVVRAEGTDAGLRGQAGNALKGTIPFKDIPPQDVHACMTGLISHHYGFNVSMSSSAGIADFKITLN